MCFEKVKFDNHSSSYLQIQFLRLDENKEIASLLAEFANKIEKADQYQKVELLTDRQKEILSFLGKGLTSKEIAEELKISFHTVEAHRKSIAKRIKINKRAALISLAVEAGMLH
ncbi:MAG TPA: LuxR C-terminal-related transcriptional regulator [Bacteroidales bacterium]|nr:LuxR C-terminal-related transcriptional regulator [Bacteroidales bacterium]